MTDLDVNCRGNLVLLEALRAENRSAKLVFVSSRLAYGRVGADAGRPRIDVPIRSACTRCTSWRSSSTCSSTDSCTGCACTIARLTNPYGPGQPQRPHRLRRRQPHDPPGARGRDAAGLRRRPPAARLHLHRRCGGGAAATGGVAGQQPAESTTSAAASARRWSTWRGRSRRSPAADGSRWSPGRRSPSGSRPATSSPTSPHPPRARLGAARVARRRAGADGGVLPGPRGVSDARIRVVYLAHAFMVGGAEEMVLNLVRHLPPRFEPMVCCIHEAGPIGEEIRRTGHAASRCWVSRRGCGGRATSSASAAYLRADAAADRPHVSAHGEPVRPARRDSRARADRHRHRSEHLRAQAAGPRARRAAADGGHRPRGRVRRVGARLLHRAGARRSGEGRRDLQRRRLRAGAADDPARARCARRSACPPTRRSPASSRGSPSRKATGILFEALAATPALADVHLLVVGGGELRDALGRATPTRTGLSIARAFSRRAARSRRSAGGDGRVRDAVAVGRAAAVAGAGDGRRRAGRGDARRRHSRSGRRWPHRTAGAARAMRPRLAPRSARCSAIPTLRRAIGAAAQAAVLPRFGVDRYVDRSVVGCTTGCSRRRAA